MCVRKIRWQHRRKWSFVHRAPFPATIIHKSWRMRRTRASGSKKPTPRSGEGVSRGEKSPHTRPNRGPIIRRIRGAMEKWGPRWGGRWRSAVALTNKGRCRFVHACMPAEKEWRSLADRIRTRKRDQRGGGAGEREGEWRTNGSNKQRRSQERVAAFNETGRTFLGFLRAANRGQGRCTCSCPAIAGIQSGRCVDVSRRTG